MMNEYKAYIKSKFHLNDYSIFPIEFLVEISY